VRVIDALVVFKDRGGEVGGLEGQPALEGRGGGVRRRGRRLLGLGAGGEEGMEAGRSPARRPRRTASDVFDEEEAWDVLEELPDDAAAALILLEHRWAIGLA
jgi:hypothetical protein